MDERRGSGPGDERDAADVPERPTLGREYERDPGAAPSGLTAEPGWTPTPGAWGPPPQGPGWSPPPQGPGWGPQGPQGPQGPGWGPPPQGPRWGAQGPQGPGWGPPPQGPGWGAQGPGWTRFRPPPGPEPGVAYAGFWIRFVAWLLDILILLLPTIIIMLPVLSEIFAALAPGPGGRLPSPVEYERRVTAVTTSGAYFAATGLIELLYVAYLTWFWHRKGQTPGMMALNLRVVRDTDGARITYGRALLRYVGFGLSSFFLIGFIWAAFDERKQAWHDKIAGTFVVRPAPWP